MKPSRFSYHRPTTISEALEHLAECGAAGKVLAGGQSLIPILNMRLAAPEHLVDINRVAGLDTIECSTDAVTIGALVRHSALLGSDSAYAAQPLLRKALRLVAHPAIRNRGTTVGSLVHADPAAEMPAILALCGGSVRVSSAQGERSVAAVDFFTGAMESALQYGELAVAATFPASPPRTGSAVVEVSRRHGDYALCGVAVTLTQSEDGSLLAARAAYFSMDQTPVVVDLSEAVHEQRDLSEVVLERATQLATRGLQPDADIHATAEYRLHLAGVLTGRALVEAFDELRLNRSAA